MSVLSHFLNINSRQEDNNSYLSSSSINGHKKFAYQHYSPARSLRTTATKPDPKGYSIKFLFEKPLLTALSLAAGFGLTYLIYLGLNTMLASLGQ